MVETAVDVSTGDVEQALGAHHLGHPGDDPHGQLLGPGAPAFQQGGVAFGQIEGHAGSLGAAQSSSPR